MSTKFYLRLRKFREVGGKPYVVTNISCSEPVIRYSLVNFSQLFFRSQHRVFHFETDDQEPWAILLAKHGINFDRVTQRIKKVPDFVLSAFQRQTKLWKL